MEGSRSKLLFIVNPGSGNSKVDWKQEIDRHFSTRQEQFEIFDLPNPCKPELVGQLINERRPGLVIAVGGDGTVKLVAESLKNTSIPLGILPAGSANGMAKEFGIPDDPEAAMNIIVQGIQRKIHLIMVNDELCIHLSDIGFNAYVVKKFEEDKTRGMWGYAKAAWKVLWQNRRMQVKLQIDDKYISRDAAMVVIANATMYGNGVVINPAGSLYDDVFEVVIIRKISFSEILKMRFTQRDFDPRKTELFQTRDLQIQSRHSVHFQVDGEVKGKVRSVKASLLPHSLTVILPSETSEARGSRK